MTFGRPLIHINLPSGQSSERITGDRAASKKSSTSAPKNWWLQTGPTTPGQEQFNEDLMFGTVASGMFRGVFTGVCDDIRAVDMMPRGRFLAMAGYLIIFQAAKSQVSRFRGWRARDVAGIVVTRLDVLRKKNAIVVRFTTFDHFLEVKNWSVK